MESVGVKRRVVYHIAYALWRPGSAQDTPLPSWLDYIPLAGFGQSGGKQVTAEDYFVTIIDISQEDLNTEEYTQRVYLFAL